MPTESSDPTSAAASSPEAPSPGAPLPSATPWWGTFEVGEEEAGRWDIGPTTLWLRRTAHEWRVLYRSTGASLEAESAVTLPLGDDAWAAVEADATNGDLSGQRHSFRSAPASVTLHPLPADRPVVVRPESPLSVPAGEAVTLYVSTPLWVQVEVAAQTLQEVPSHRPSDTWFGPSTREGELCYAARTSGRLRIDDVPLRMHRAVTPLHVHNRATDGLPLERVQVPAPHLTVYASDTQGLWTDAVTVTRRASGDPSSVEIDAGPPAPVEAAQQVHGPRETTRKGLVVTTFRALEALFGSG